MPPSLILEVLRITELEMDLRDLTRETEQARPATLRAEWEESAELLTAEQHDLVWRTDEVIDEVVHLPDGETDFAQELAALRGAVAAMRDAEIELESPTTGPVVIAAETEAIEFLLQARRAGRGGGGGGGNSPGGGLKKGQTDVSALALVGRSEDPNARIDDREVAAATGRSGDALPEELRATLDRYFEKLNGGR